VLHADQVRTLIRVEPVLAATAAQPHDPAAVVTIRLDPGIDWRAVVQRWRQLGQVPVDTPGVVALDAAAIRFLYQQHLGAAQHIPLRLGGQLAGALQVSRAYIQLIVSGQRLPQAQPADLPAGVQQFLADLLMGRPLDGWMEHQEPDR